MTTLVVEELITELYQDINYTSDERAIIASIMPYLLIYNSPAGVFTFSVLNGAEVLFSKTFTSADIKASISTSNNYAHVFYPIVPTTQVELEKGTYRFKLTSSGYTFSESSYIGWIKQHEDLQLPLDYIPTDDFDNPLSIRIKTFKRYL
jgi:hypothetical protein